MRQLPAALAVVSALVAYSPIAKPRSLPVSDTGVSGGPSIRYVSYFRGPNLNTRRSRTI